MLLKWKCILTNWINCYCNERDCKDLDINIDSLLIIISQLRKNLSLDDSRSSLLEAHNIQEFMVEKYPNFKFENGTSEPSTKEDLSLSASLLLFFVCVNSKNIYLKNAMCSKLSSSDQETILKFSKCLMGCSNITFSDVLQAITEACGQDIAGVETVSTNTIAETPPALRSLHSEVRRLQAALDAERFDRNYLQEELSRTNLKLEKLSKIKEQYKLEIVNLKSKLSESCGDENSTAGNEATRNNSVKLVKQLEQAEERLANLQEELSNAEYERNSYKNKLDELKRDRDKYLALSQQESIRASQLAEELDSERQQCNSLRELVTELRQHHRLNRMDLSQLECDELDTSVLSLQQNSSVCSEVCASIIEVQLAEERNKIGTLKAQMQMLQDQLTELNNKYEKEKLDFSKTISEKDSHIMELKHRVNEEIESKNVIKSQSDNDITKLNNEINELEQTLKDTTKNTRKIIDTKMQEIQILQEEKLSLLQSFTNETAKLETKITELKKEVEAEKSSKQKIREDYDNHIMKLNEKVLNRNNELVELQNKIVEKGEEIENIQIQLRKEKDMRQELINKHNKDALHYNNVIKEFNCNAQKSSADIAELQKQVQQYYQCIEEMNKERNDLNTSLHSLKEDVKNLTGEKQLWLKEKEKFQHEIDEKNETINSLKTQLQTEIQFKHEIQGKLDKINAENELLSEEKITLSNKLSTVMVENTDACEKLNALNQYIIEEKEMRQSLQIQLDNSTKKIQEVLETLEHKKDEIKHLEEKVTSLEQCNEKLTSEFESERLILKNMVSVTESVMEDQKISFTYELEEYATTKKNLQDNIKKLEEVIKGEKQSFEAANMELDKIKQEKDQLENTTKQLQADILEKTTVINNLNKEKINLTKIICENDEIINKQKVNIKTLMEDKVNLTSNLQSTKQEFLNKIEKLEKETTSLKENLFEVVQAKNTLEMQLHTSEIEIEKKNNDIQTMQKELDDINAEKLSIEENNLRLQEDIVQETSYIEKLRSENNELSDMLKLNKKTINVLKDEVKEHIEDKNKLLNDFNSEKKQILGKVEKLENENKTCNETLQKRIQHLEEVIVKEKQNAKMVLDEKVDEIKTILEELNNFKKDKQNIDANLSRLQEDIIQKTSYIETLKSENNELVATFQVTMGDMDRLKKEIKTKAEDQKRIINDFESEKSDLLNKIEALEKEIICLGNIISENKNCEKALHRQIQDLEYVVETEKEQAQTKIEKKVKEIEIILTELNNLKKEKQNIEENMTRLQEDIVQKTSYIETIKCENNDLVTTLKLNREAMSLLEEEIKSVNNSKEKLITELETEKLELKNIIAETQEIMEKQRQSLNNQIMEETQSKGTLQEQITYLQQIITQERQMAECKINEIETYCKKTLNELNMIKEEKMALAEKASFLDKEVSDKVSQLEIVTKARCDLEKSLEENMNNFETSKCVTKDVFCNGVKKIIDYLIEGGINSDIIKKLEAVQNTNELSDSFDSIVEAVHGLTKELSVRKSLEKALEQENTAVEQLTSLVKQKDINVNRLQEELNDFQKLHMNTKLEFSKQADAYKDIIEAKTKEVERLVLQNTTLHNELNDVKVQLDTKVHSLKDKLIDNENITDKLKATYESQIDNLNVMVSKLTSYMKEKTIEMEVLIKEKNQLEEALYKSNKSISLLVEEVKCQKQKHEKLINEFESERVVLTNMVTVTEAVMEDQKLSLNNKVTELCKQNDVMKEHIETLQAEIAKERVNAEIILKDKGDILNMALKELSDVKDENKSLEGEVSTLKGLLSEKEEQLELTINDNNSLIKVLETVKQEKSLVEHKQKEVEADKESQIIYNTNLVKEKENEITTLKEEIERQVEAIKELQLLQETLILERDEVAKQLEMKDTLLETEKNLRLSQLDEIQKLQQLQAENILLQNTLKEKQSEIVAMKEHLEDLNQQVSDESKKEQINLANKCKILEEYQVKAEEELKNRQDQIEILVSDMESTKNEYAKVELEKNHLIEKLKKEEMKYLHYKQQVEECNKENKQLRENLNLVNTNTVYNLKKENELLLKAVTNNENMAVNDKENIVPNYRDDVGLKIRDMQNQVHDSAFDNTTTSVDSSKTITDLEKIIQDKNRTITTLHSDITYLKTLIAESENKLLDVTKDLDLSRENCHQLSNQLKKVVHQKNEEISELKNKVIKISAAENHATQIIKVSAKYQAMIFKRIAEIKNNTSVLKELTNFGNSAISNGDNELRRRFNAGNITMEDLENFLETTDRHLKRCSEKQIALQKERDRLLEINKINDSEIIAMRKFLTELSVSVKTFNSVKDLYSQKLNRVIALQRTVRREILNLDGRINDATMCKLERGYAAIMQDLSECALNLERWVDRSIVRSISPEKIKQAFMSELDRASLVPTNFQNTSLEIQFGELESSFQKLLKEVMQAQSGEGVKDTQALTLMEVRAEYEDKLSRMKAKMKELYVDQINQFQEKQKKEIEEYERKLQKANEELQESSKAYQHHIKGLTTELWNVGEKFIIQQDEAQWLRKKQQSGSLMSLQHVHSTGLMAPRDEPGRPSDTHSLRSLPAHRMDKNEKKGRKTCADISDEEGEVFDNRCLRELSETPRRARPSVSGASALGVTGARLSELQRRNTLCRPHLKSSYPAETQFVPGVHEDDIRCYGSMSLGGKAQRKEVGITAYKKPGPPTPSKQAGRLSATDSELRESLRVEAEPSARRVATPSRLLGLFRGNKHDTTEGTPRSRRLSNIFRKK